MLEESGREGLDLRWVIVPSGGISKVGTFIRLFGSNDLNVAVLTDFHKGIKSHVKSLKESGDEVMADYNAMSAPDEDAASKNEPQTEKISS